MADKNNSEDNEVTLANLIPDLHYDIIAKAIPGCMFLLLALWMVSENNSLESFIISHSDTEKISQIIIFVISGYIIGFMLTKLLGIFEFIFYKLCIAIRLLEQILLIIVFYIFNKLILIKINKFFKIVKEFTTNTIIKNNHVFIFGIITKIYELEYSSYAINNKNNRKVITKILAELVFFKCIFISWLILNLFRFLSPVSSKILDKEFLKIKVFDCPSWWFFCIFLTLAILHHLTILKQRLDAIKKDNGLGCAE